MSTRRPLDGLGPEIQYHIEQETRENIERGMTPEAARAAALRKFGNITRVEEDTRAVSRLRGFTLCSGFSSVVMQMQGIADNSANVLLNGVVLGPTSAFNVAPLTIPANAGLLRVGNNCFQVQVTNVAANPAPTGFAIGGLLRVTGGKCPCSPLPILAPPTLGTHPSGNAEP
ncbi:MAG TPA: permease prefix domain 1-containing protein [Bryobacteraceae bacterium]